MAFDIGPKIGIEGEAEFRAAIRDVNTSLKTLSTEMGTVTSAFGKNQQSEAALTAKNEVLNREIDKQKEKLDKLKQGLSASSEKYGENDEKTQKWQQAVNKAQETLNKQNNELDENKKSLETLKSGVKDTADAEEDASKKTSTFGDMLKANLAGEAIKNGIQQIANAVKGLASSLKNAVVDGTAYADNIMTMSTVTGLSTDALQKYQYMSELTDTSLETITGSLTKLTKNMQSAKGGTGSAATAFKDLGISITNSDGSLRSNQDVFADTLGALGKMKNETQRNAYAMSIFGKSAQDLNPMIAAGSDGVKKFAKEAEDMGYVLDTKTLASLGKADDAFRRFDNMTTVVKNQIAVALAPVVTDISDKMMKWAQSVDWNAVSQKVQTAVTKIWASIKKVDFSGLATTAKNAVNGIKSGIDKLSESKGKIEEVMQAFKVLVPFIVAAKIATEGYKTACALSGIASAVKKGVMGIVTSLGAQTTATGVQIGEQGALNAVMSANPFGLVAIAIAGVITALVTLYKHNAEFRAQVNQLRDDLEKFASIIGNGAKKLFTETIPNAGKAMVDWFKDLPHKLESIGANMIKGLWNGMNDKIDWLIDRINGLCKRSLNAFKDLPHKLESIGANMIKGLWNGMNDKIDWLIDKIKGFCKRSLNAIKDFFGIHSPSTVMAEQGDYLMQGLGLGIERSAGDVLGKLDIFNAGLLSKQTEAVGRISALAGYSFGTLTSGGNTQTQAQTNAISAALSSGVSAIADVLRVRQESTGTAVANITVNSVLDGQVIGRAATQFQLREAKAVGR
jgi:phage-related protein